VFGINTNREDYAACAWYLRKYTIRIEMAVGVTPEMRLAWPSVSGENRASF
jgi:hypothetical protein